MAEQNGAIDAETDALKQIAQRIDNSDDGRTEITEDELDALDIFVLRNRRTNTQQSVENLPRAKGKRNTIPIEHSLHRVDGEWLAVETSKKNAGEKRVRNYAIGVGELQLDGYTLDEEVLSEELPDEPSENIEEAVEMYRMGVEETFRIQMDEDEHAALFDGKRLYGWSPAYGDLTESATLELEADGEEAFRAVKEARNLRKPSDIDYYVVEFVASISTDHSHLIDQ